MSSFIYCLLILQWGIYVTTSNQEQSSSSDRILEPGKDYTNNNLRKVTTTILNATDNKYHYVIIGGWPPHMETRRTKPRRTKSRRTRTRRRRRSKTRRTKTRRHRWSKTPPYIFINPETTTKRWTKWTSTPKTRKTTETWTYFSLKTHSRVTKAWQEINRRTRPRMSRSTYTHRGAHLKLV